MPGSPRDPRQPYARWEQDPHQGQHSGSSYDPYSSADPDAQPASEGYAGSGYDPLVGGAPADPPTGAHYGQFYDQERDELGWDHPDHYDAPPPGRGRHCAPEPVESFDAGGYDSGGGYGSGYVPRYAADAIDTANTADAGLWVGGEVGPGDRGLVSSDDGAPAEDDLGAFSPAASAGDVLGLSASGRPRDELDGPSPEEYTFWSGESDRWDRAGFAPSATSSGSGRSSEEGPGAFLGADAHDAGRYRYAGSVDSTPGADSAAASAWPDATTAGTYAGQHPTYLPGEPERPDEPGAVDDPGDTHHVDATAGVRPVGVAPAGSAAMSTPPGGTDPDGSDSGVEAYGVDPTVLGGGYVARYETSVPAPGGGGSAGSAGSGAGGGAVPPGSGPPAGSEPPSDDDPSGHSAMPGRRSARRREPRRSFKQAIGLTVLGGLIPGTGFLAAGRRRLGFIILGALAVLAVLLLWMVTIGRHQTLDVVLDPETLVGVGVGLVLVGLAWVSVIVATHRLVRPREMSTWQRLAGSVVVSVLALAVLVPMMVASRYAFVSGDTFQTIFAGDDSKSETRPDVSKEDPWGGQRRVNVLLLGGDGGEGREGVRTDSVMVASIDTKTGRTVLLSLPRNLENLPFPEGKLRQAYPDGFQGESGLEADSMLNAVYRVVPSENPGIFDSDHPGADALKLGVGEALGLRIDYFTLINLNGFEELINALGGITVNVNERVAVGGSDEHGIPPRDYIEPGPHKHLNGERALWYARGRYGSSDFDRMDRQRCAINAIIARAKPAEVLRRYEAIASSSKNLVETDIPASLLPAFVDLSLQVKNAKVSSIVYDSNMIAPADPDYDEIRNRAQNAIKAAEQDDNASKDGTGNGGAQDGSGKNGSKKKPESKPSKDSSDSGSGSSDGSSSGGSSGSQNGDQKDPDSVEQSCAYNPVE